MPVLHVSRPGGGYAGLEGGTIGRKGKVWVRDDVEKKGQYGTI